MLTLVPLTGVGFTFPVFLLRLVELKLLSAKQLGSVRKWVYVLVAFRRGLANPAPTLMGSIPINITIYPLFEVKLKRRCSNQYCKGGDESHGSF